MWFSFLEGVRDRGTRAFPIYRVSRPINQILNSPLPGTDTSLPSNKWGLLKPLTNNYRLPVFFRTVLTKSWCIILGENVSFLFHCFFKRTFLKQSIAVLFQKFSQMPIICTPLSFHYFCGFALAENIELNKCSRHS